MNPFFSRIPRADFTWKSELARHQNRLTKPPGSLGRLEELATRMGAFQKCAPTARPAAAIHFAADHPVTRHGISPYPQEVTRAMLGNFAGGGAASSVLCHLHGLPLTVFDVGVEGDPEPSTNHGTDEILRVTPLSGSTEGDITAVDAMTPEVFDAALEQGRSAFATQSPRPSVVLLGEMGIGNTTLASCVCAGILGRDHPEFFVGAGTGADDAMLEKKKAVVRDAVSRLGPQDGPLDVLRRVGGRELAALLGAMAEALEHRSIVLVDGFITTSVALVLCQLVPHAREGLVFAHCSAEKGHQFVLSHLKASPLLDLEMRLGEGSGALVAYPLLVAAAELHNEMATFEGASVPDRPPQQRAPAPPVASPASDRQRRSS